MDRADAAVILCAGGSRRMGQPKGLLDLDGRPLLARIVDALAPAARRIVVVLGRDPEAHRRALADDVEVIVNPAWATTWPADSLRLALVEADVRGAVLVSPVDVAPPRPATLAALLARGAPAVPVDPAGRDGHPVLLGPPLVAQVRARAPDGGLRALLGDAARVPVDDPWVAEDFDDPAAWRAFLAGRPRG